MDKEELKVLLDKFKAGTATEQEQAIVEDWYSFLPLEVEAPSHDQILESKSRSWGFVAAKMQSDSSHSLRLWPRIAVVAAAVALIVLGVYFFNYIKRSDNNNKSLAAQDVAPGKVGATLTLASGKKIRLTNAANGELANEAGISITKTTDGQLVYEIKGSDADPNKINTLSTAKGETYQVRLPDGSMVYLNAASSLTYAASLIERGKRTVKLRGEGYFEISKDKKHPFVVKTDKQEVEVLGTHFNINAYEDEPVTKTTLLEGRIRVSANAKTKFLKAGQQAVLTNKEIILKDVEPEDAIDWKSGYFMFNSESLESGLKRIARWYNVQIAYEDESLKQEPFFGRISKFEKISKVLNMLERTDVVRFKIIGNKIIACRKK
jgi:transmembrane sensor